MNWQKVEGRRHGIRWQAKKKPEKKMKIFFNEGKCEGWMKKGGGWKGRDDEREGGRDEERLIIYDSLDFPKQPSGPAPCFPLTFNLSGNQRVWSLIIVSVCQRLCLHLWHRGEITSCSVRTSAGNPLGWNTHLKAAPMQTQCISV